MTLELLLEYIVYGAIIVVSVLILWLIKRKTKLPTHLELKRRIVDFRTELSDFIESERGEGRATYDFFKRTSKCIYAADKLVYVITLMAEKERDGNLDKISAIMETARNALSGYKFKMRGKEDLSGFETALEQTDRALTALEQILERDKDLNRKQR